MELHSKYLAGLVCVMVLLPALCTSQGFTSSRATFHGIGIPPRPGYCDINPNGACGYGDYSRTMNNGRVVAVGGELWRDGAGCGACYQVRCKDPKYCDEHGIVVVATDHAAESETDLEINPCLLERLLPNIKYGVVDIEYRKVPCTYAGYNVKIKIQGSSRYPDYLAIVLLYVPGMNDVTAVEIYQNDSKEWRPMRRVYGAVFDIVGAPSGPLTLRLQFSGRRGWVQSTKSAIPGDWKIGASYDSQVHV